MIQMNAKLMQEQEYLLKKLFKVPMHFLTIFL